LSDFSNIDLFKGILGQNQAALKYLYSRFYPNVAKMIKHQGGQEDDANDIFQEAIIIFYRKAKSGQLDSNYAVEPYLMSTCRIIWLKTLQSRQKDKEALPTIEAFEEESPIYKEFLESKRKELFYKHFKMLSIECQNTLSAFFNGSSFQQIADELGLTSEEFARRKKYLCKEYLVKSIKSDPEYDNISYQDGNEPF
jgi:RNA polymerase sigma factor, sigma-70 family